MSLSFVVIISGGSGSGKTTLAQALLKNLGENNVQILEQDNYYIDQSKNFDGDGNSVNFDHPKALDFCLMLKQMSDLKNKKDIQAPCYDVATHSRTKATKQIKSKAILIVEGTLILAQKKLRELGDLNIFVDCQEDLRFSRRLHRDTTERGRTVEGVRAQFVNQVTPMHNQFVEGSKIFANNIVTVNNFDKKILEITNNILKQTPLSL